MARSKPRRARGSQKPGLSRFLASAQRRGWSQRRALTEWRARGGSIRDANFREAWRVEARQLPGGGAAGFDLDAWPRWKRLPERAYVKVPVREGRTRYVHHVQVLVSAPRTGVAIQMVQVVSGERHSRKWAEERAARMAEGIGRYRWSALDAQLKYLTKEVRA